MKLNTGSYKLDVKRINGRAAVGFDMNQYCYLVAVVFTVKAANDIMLLNDNIGLVHSSINYNESETGVFYLAELNTISKNEVL